MGHITPDEFFTLALLEQGPPSYTAYPRNRRVRRSSSYQEFNQRVKEHNELIFRVLNSYYEAELYSYMEFYRWYTQHAPIVAA